MFRKYLALVLVSLAGLCRLATAHPNGHTEPYPETESDLLYMHNHAKDFCFLSQYSADGSYIIDSGTARQPLRLVNVAPTGHRPMASVNLSWSYIQFHPLSFADFTIVVTKGKEVTYRDAAENTWGTEIDSARDGMSGTVEYRVIHDPTGVAVEEHSAYWNFNEPLRTAYCKKVDAKLGSIDVQIPLGNTSYGRLANDLTFYSETLSNPGIANLKFRGLPATGGSTLTFAGNLLSTVQTGNSLATIVSTPTQKDSNCFTIYFTYVNDPRPSPPSPVYREVVVGIVDGGLSGNHFKVEETINGATTTNIWANPGGERWVFIENDTRKTIKDVDEFWPNPNEHRYVYSIEEKAPDGSWKTISREAQVEKDFSWGREVISTTADPNGEALVSTRKFYRSGEPDPAQPRPSYAKVKEEVLPTGHTRHYRYLDLDPGEPDSTKQEIITENYAGVEEGKETTISSSIVANLITVVEEVRVLGKLVSKKETISSQNNRTEKVYPSNGGAPLITTNSYVDGGLETIFPDGTREKTTETEYNGILTRTVFKGTRNPSWGHYLIRGTEKVELISRSGVVKQTTEYQIENGVRYRVEGRVTADEDEQERPEREDVYHGDATTPTYSEYLVYDCCGLSQFTGRDGITSRFFRDGLGRVWKTHKNGISEETIRDGQTLRRYRFPEALATAASGADAANLVSSQSTGLDGEVTSWQSRSPKDGSLLTTTKTVDFAVSSSVGMRTVLTLPATADDLGVPAQTIEDHYPDGQLKERSGAMVPPQRFTYDATLLGLVESSSLVNSSNNTIETETRQLDWAGRDLSLTFAGDANGDQQPDQIHFTYGLSGRLSKVVDPDGVRTLFNEDLVTGTATTAVDVNANDVIDAEVDRISITRDGVGLDSAGKVVLWEEGRARDTNVQNESFEKLVSRNEARVDGLRKVSIRYGGGQTATTMTSKVFLPGQAGAWDSTTTWPDGTYTVDKVRGGVTDLQEHYNSIGQLLRTQDFSYDGYLRTESVADSRGPVTNYEYVSPLVDLVERTTVGSDVTEVTFDERGRMISVDRPDSLDNTGATVSNTRISGYWPNGKLREESGTPGYHVTYTYDEAQRLRTQTTYGTAITTTRWIYDANRGWLSGKRYNSPSDNQGSLESFTYTAAGRQKTRTSIRGVVATTAYDSTGESSGITYSDGTAPLTISVRDQMGRVRELSDAAGARKLRYDGWGGLAVESYQTGSLLSGWQVSQDRDALGRLSGLRAGMSGTGISDHGIAYGYDTAGRVESVASGGKSASYSYDPVNHMLQQVAIWDGSSNVLYGTMRYDSLLRLRRVSYHNGQNGGGLKVYSDNHYSRDAEGKISSVTSADGSQEVYGYNGAGELVSSKRRISSGSSSYLAGQNYSWSYDGIGNRVTMGKGGDSSGGGLPQMTYDAPDALNQHDSVQNPKVVDVFGAASASATVTVNGGATSRQGDYFYQELIIDNSDGPAFEAVSVADGTNTKAGFIEVPAEEQQFTHDADGNLKTDGIREYSWDGENRLKKVETLTAAVMRGIPYLREQHLYDSESRRVRTEIYDSPSATMPVKTKRYLWAGWRCLGEMGTTDSLEKCFVWGLDSEQQLDLHDSNGALLWTDDLIAGETHFSHYDGNGNVVGLSDSAGTPTAEYRYSPFGEPTVKRGSYADANAYRFSTKPVEVSSGSLYYYGYRTYDTSQGRWLSRDPLGEIGGANLRGFVLNDPINGFDKLGLYTTLKKAQAAAALWAPRAVGAAAAWGMAEGVGMTALEDYAARRALEKAGQCDDEALLRAIATPFGTYLKNGAVGAAWGVATFGVFKGAGVVLKGVGKAVTPRLGGFALFGSKPGKADFSNAAALADKIIEIAQSPLFRERAKALGFADDLISQLPARIRSYGDKIGLQKGGGWADAEQFLIGKHSMLSTMPQRIRHELTHVLDDIANPGLFARGASPDFGFSGFFKAELKAYGGMYGVGNPVNVPLAAFNAAGQAFPVTTKVAVFAGSAGWLGYKYYPLFE